MAETTTSNAMDFSAVRSPIGRGLLVAGAREGGRELDRLAVSRPSAAVSEESLVIEVGRGVMPAQMVESKLKALLERSSLPLSDLPMRGLARVGR